MDIFYYIAQVFCTLERLFISIEDGRVHTIIFFPSLMLSTERRDVCRVFVSKKKKNWILKAKPLLHGKQPVLQLFPLPLILQETGGLCCPM